MAPRHHWDGLISIPIAVNIGGFGQHIKTAKPATVTAFFQMLYVVQLVYLFAIAFIKFSILLFFRRIFSIPQIKAPLFVMSSIVASWLIAAVLTSQAISIEIHVDSLHRF